MPPSRCQSATMVVFSKTGAHSSRVSWVGACAPAGSMAKKWPNGSACQGEAGDGERKASSKKKKKQPSINHTAQTVQIRPRSRKRKPSWLVPQKLIPVSETHGNRRGPRKWSRRRTCFQARQVNVQYEQYESHTTSRDFKI